IKNDYKVMTSLSIVHLFALSGMHITILYQILFKIFSLFLKKHHADILSKIVMGVYVFSIPFNISLQRAYLMLIGKSLFHRQLNELDLLALLVCGHLLYNPYVIFHMSFVFSYFIYFMVILTKRLKGQSLLVYLSSMPLVLSMNASLNLFSFFLGTVLEPFISFFYTLFVLSLFLPLDLALNIFIKLFQSILDFTNALSAYLIFSKPSLFFIAIFYYCIFACIIQQERQLSLRRPVCLLVALMLSFSVYSRYKIYTDVTMIDVGQGDCTLVRLPFDRGNYLIDTGGQMKYDLATNKIIPYLKSIGISRIDAVFISHYDYDHSGALDSLKSHFDVRNVIDKPFDKIKKGNVTLESLTTDHVFHDINDNSNVIYMTVDHIKYLFTGDLGVEGEEALMRKYGNLDVDILKVGHHGSKTSSSIAFITMLKPKVALIGVGEKNRYGHPSPVVIKRLNNMGCTILRTDQDGSFTIRHMLKEYYIINEKS
ncbi:MAG: ComEC/Rec2 family competence protein, partial [Sharpea porci]